MPAIGNEMKKRYVLHPGIVTSAAEGKCYFISASTLAFLYGVDFEDCRVADPGCAGDKSPEEVHLYPALEESHGRHSLAVECLSTCA